MKMRSFLFATLLMVAHLEVYCINKSIYSVGDSGLFVPFHDGSVFHIDDSLLKIEWPDACVKPSVRVAKRGVFSHNLRLHFTPDNPTIPNYLIIAENSLYNSLSAEVKTYAEDAHAIYGYGVYIETVQYPTPEDVKSLIVSYNNLCGVLFIGDVGECLFEIDEDHGEYGYRRWPCDLYYMDLDGIWMDHNYNGIYDIHYGNVAPDIFFGRLSTVGLSSLGDEIALIRRQLRKSHEYWWKSSFHASSTVLNYIDIDWNDMFFPNEIVPVFSSGNVTDIRNGSSTGTNFSVSDYLSRIANSSYGFTHLAAHSSPEKHHFTNGYIYTSDINAVNSYNYAYNLFCCNACNWSLDSIAEYIGGSYLFNNGKTLTVIGSTKTGGMENSASFYSMLPANHIGNAFKLWWNILYGNNHSLNAISWSYGMTILGDPIIDTRYKVSNKCVNSLILTEFPNENSSNLVIYKAGSSINVSGSFVIPQGVHVVFDAPTVTLESTFSCPLGASFEIRNEGCEL